MSADVGAAAPRVLLVEDDDDIAFLESRILTDDGWIVSVARTGEAGVQLAREELPDLVLSDLHMPGGDGLHVVRELQSDPSTARIPIILVSGDVADEHLAVGLEAGAHDYIKKPFRAPELTTRCRAALRVRRQQDALHAMAEATAASAQTHRACLHALEQGVALVALNGEVQVLNEAGARILGRSAEEMTAIFQSGGWDTFREDGSLMPSEERPLTETVHTGAGVAERVVCWQRRVGELVTLRVATELVHDGDGAVSAFVVAFADITAQRAAEKAERSAVELLAWQATHDALTGLANRTVLFDHLAQRVRDHDGARTAVLFVDLDHFKVVNDTLGHDIGDAMLHVVAQRLTHAVRESDLVARYGGDEFVVVLDIDAPGEADDVVDRILDELAQPAVILSREVAISVSIGLSYATKADPAEILRDADAALLRAKQAGRNRVARIGPVAG